jgi:hypothetical protein
VKRGDKQLSQSSQHGGLARVIRAYEDVDSFIEFELDVVERTQILEAKAEDRHKFSRVYLLQST